MGSLLTRLKDFFAVKSGQQKVPCVIKMTKSENKAFRIFQRKILELPKNACYPKAGAKQR